MDVRCRKRQAGARVPRRASRAHFCRGKPVDRRVNWSALFGFLAIRSCIRARYGSSSGSGAKRDCSRQQRKCKLGGSFADARPIRGIRDCILHGRWHLERSGWQTTPVWNRGASLTLDRCRSLEEARPLRRRSPMRHLRGPTPEHPDVRRTSPKPPRAKPSHEAGTREKAFASKGGADFDLGSGRARHRLYQLQDEFLAVDK